MKKVLHKIVAPFLYVSYSALAFAQERLPVETTGDVIRVLDRIINWLFTFLLIGAVIAIILAAYNYLTSGGDPEKVKQANRMITYAAIAIVIGFLAQGMVFIVKQLVSGGSSSDNSRYEIQIPVRYQAPGINR